MKRILVWLIVVVAAGFTVSVPRGHTSPLKADSLCQP